MKLNILLISEDANLYERIRSLCQSEDFHLSTRIDKLDDLVQALQKTDYDILISCTRMNKQSLLKTLNQHHHLIKRQTPVLFILDGEPRADETILIKRLQADFIGRQLIQTDFLAYVIRESLEKRKQMIMLKENEFRYRSLYDHTLDINLIIDNNYEIVNTNVQGRKRMKYEPNTKLQKIFDNPNDFNQFKSLLDEVGQVSQFETLLRLKKRKVYCLIDAFKLYNEFEEVSGAHLVIRNIDETRKSQALANQASKLLVTGKFLRSLAHEIRNPLTNINLALEQLDHEQAVKTNGEIYTDIIARSANRVKDLLNRVMDAYKNAEIELKEERLHNIIENALRFANDRLVFKGIRTELKLTSKDDSLQADKLKLTTAILNLLVNSSEAISHDKGKISIQTSKMKNQLKLTIKDNGCGMDEKQVKALFDPFYTGKSKGLGLGLTTCQNVIFAHKGTIEVESELNKGTRFIIQLPVN